MNGELVWAKSWGTNSDDYISAIIADSSGDIYLAGETQGYGTGSVDCLVLKFSSVGELLWSRTWGGVDADRIETLTFSSAGNLLVGGRTFSFGAGHSDALILEYSLAGDLLLQRIWGGFGWDEITSFTFDRRGMLFIGGCAGSSQGAWDTPNGSESNPIGIVAELEGVEYIPDSVLSEASGVETVPEATLDTGGGGWNDILLMKIDPMQWE